MTEITPSAYPTLPAMSVAENEAYSLGYRHAYDALTTENAKLRTSFAAAAGREGGR